MRFSWLRRSGQGSCIAFFAGWGMDPRPFEEIPAAGYDVCIFFDYRDLLLPNAAGALADYEAVHVVGWSMGVWASSWFAGVPPFTGGEVIAVCGTRWPVDVSRGVPPDACSRLADTLSKATLRAFHRSMFSDPDEAERFLAVRPRRSVAEVREELLALCAAFRERGVGRDVFRSCIVGAEDAVFPVRNQVRAWGRGNYVRLRAPHFPFGCWESWDGLLRFAGSGSGAVSF